MDLAREHGEFSFAIAGRAFDLTDLLTSMDALKLGSFLLTSAATTTNRQRDVVESESASRAVEVAFGHYNALTRT